MPAVAASTCCILLHILSCATHTAWASVVLPYIVLLFLFPESLLVGGLCGSSGKKCNIRASTVKTDLGVKAESDLEVSHTIC